MASTTPNMAVLERAEVHRSAKTLEVIIALFHDYCQAISACAVVQKKLSRAMKDAANVKGTHTSAVNAFSAASAAFEGLSEVDTKFARLCEREYEGLSGELKKWFKKMAKEEKVHDEYAHGVQSRLKTAAQGYDKKSKGRFSESTTDHTRYVNQLNTLTNELSQARTAHSTYITTKHTSVILFTGATMTRLADAEWGRCCEEVRRCSTVVGRVGEWRAHCEGGWVGQLPGDLVNLDQVESEERAGDTGRLDSVAEEAELQPPKAFSLGMVPNSPTPGSPSPAYATLSPPVGRPLPVAPGSPAGSNRGLLIQTAYGALAQAAASSTSVNLPTPGAAIPGSPTTPGRRLPDPATPQPLSQEQTGYPFPDTSHTPSKDAGSAMLRRSPPRYLPPLQQEGDRLAQRQFTADSLSSRENTSLQQPENVDTPISILRKESQADIANRSVAWTEQSSARSAEGGDIAAPRPLFIAPPPPLPDRPRHVVRSQSIDSTHSNGSVVAAMRERYGDRPNMPTSPTPRDQARFSSGAVGGPRALQTDTTGSSRASIPPSSFAIPTTGDSRYRRTSFEPAERERAVEKVVPGSPSSSRDRPSSDHGRRRSRDWAEERDIIEDRDREAARRRRQDEVELEDRETSLRNRERELERRARDLEREKDKILRDRERDYGTDRGESGGRGFTNTARSRDWERERRTEGPQSPTARSAYSPPPLLSSFNGGRPDKSTSSSGHASSCGCHDCSAKHYAAPSSLPRPGPYGTGGSSNERFSSSVTSLGLSSHPATSPHMSSNRPPMLKVQTSNGNLPQGPSPPESAGGQKRGVFANLKRLSLGAALSAGISDSNGSAVRTLMTPIESSEEKRFGSISPAGSTSPKRAYDDRDRRTSMTASMGPSSAARR